MFIYRWSLSDLNRVNFQWKHSLIFKSILLTDGQSMLSFLIALLFVRIEFFDRNSSITNISGCYDPGRTLGPQTQSFGGQDVCQSNLNLFFKRTQRSSVSFEGYWPPFVMLPICSRDSDPIGAQTSTQNSDFDCHQ